jgi:hypothetical protein
MSQFVPFDVQIDVQSDSSFVFDDSGVPEHTQKTLENYLLDGLPPGGFVEAVLTNNLFRAVSNADSVNSQRLWEITRWVLKYAPALSWGSKERIRAWCDPESEERIEFRDKVLKEKMWSRLKT